jgi:hypothetical protein
VSTIVHAGTYNIFFTPATSRFNKNDTLVVPFYAENRDGSRLSSKKFTYELRKDSGGKFPVAVLKGEVATDDNGKAIVREQFPKDILANSGLRLVIQGAEEQSAIHAEKYIFIEPEESDTKNSSWSRFDSSQTYLKIVSSSNSFIVGDTLSLSVTSPISVDALVSLERGRVYEPKIVHLEQGENTVKLQVSKDLSPSITVVFSFFVGGEYKSEGLSLNVPAMHKLLNVSLSTDKPSYATGESALVSLLVTDAQNLPVVSQMSLGIVDKAIYALRKSATPMIHSALYYFRPRSTNASSSLTWIGSYDVGGRGGGGGMGGNGDSKLIDTLYWNPNIVTDDMGKASVTIPLGQTKTTWKAIGIGTTDASDVGQGETELLVR